MSDTTLNQFISRGTNAQRVAFTPSPATPASGNNPSYIFYETDTGNTYMWDGSAWQKINTGSGGTSGPIPAGLGWDGNDHEEVIVAAPSPFASPQVPGLVPASGGGTTNFLRADGQWAAPSGGGGGGSVSIVQTKSFIGDSSGTATLTLTSTPTAGNLLVTVSSYWTSGMSVNSSWSIARNIAPGTNSGTLVAYRLVADGDTSSLSSSMNNPSSYAIAVFEVSGAYPVPALCTTFGQTSGTSYNFHYGCPKANSYLIGAITSEAANTAPNSSSGCTLGTTVTGTTTNASPREITPFTQGTLAAGASGPATVGYAASVNRYGGSVLLFPA